MSTYFEDEDSGQSNNNDGDSTGLKMSLRERPRQIQTRQRLRKQAEEELKFMQDFDPEKSIRERRKLSRKPFITPPASKNTAYDERGRLRENYINICDCMEERCPGCFFPCPTCDSTKCGPVCRINRKFTFESIEFDGKDGVIKNRYAGRY